MSHERDTVETERKLTSSEASAVRRFRFRGRKQENRENTAAEWALKFKAGSIDHGILNLLAEENAFGRGFLFAPLFIALGAVWWFQRPLATEGWGIAFYAGLTLFAAFLLRHRNRIVFLIISVLSLLLSGALLAQIETDRRSTIMLDTPVTTHVTGLVESRERTSSGWRYVVAVQRTADPEIQRPPQRVTLVARGDRVPVPVGGQLAGLARLSPPSAPALPGLVDFGFLSYFDGVGAVGFFYGAPDSVEAAPETDTLLGNPLSGRIALAIARLRDTISNRIRLVLPGETGAFANAIITGQRRGMDDEALTALRNAGLAHVIAISGLHMALAAGIFFASLRLIMASSAGLAEGFATKKVAAIAALGAAFFYLLVSGMQVSARRAFIMLAIMLVATILNRPAISLRNVAIAAFVILFFSPSEATGPGMQMSFAATLALISGYSLWQGHGGASYQPRHANLIWARLIVAAGSGIVLTSLIGGISTAPYAMEHFHRMAGYGLLGNLLAMPIVTFIVMPAGLAAMLAMPLNLHTPFLLLMGTALGWVLEVAHWVDGLGGAVATGQMPTGFLLLFTAGFMPLVLLKTRLRLFGLLPIVASAILFALPTGAENSARLLVSEDGELLAIIDGDEAFVSKKRPPSFIYEQWEGALAIKNTTSPLLLDAPETETSFIESGERFERMTPEQIGHAEQALLATIANAGNRSDMFYCRKDLWCVAKLADSGITVIQIKVPALTGIACDHGQVVISRYRPGFQRCRSGSFLVTPRMRRQTGTLVFEPKNSNQDFMGETKEGNTRRQKADPQTKNVNCTNVQITPSLRTLNRQWNRHRLYDWRKKQFQEPISLPETLCL